MYAIVEIAGQQFKVAKDQKVFTHRLAGNEGDKISFDKVLFTADGDKMTLGAPAIKGLSVGAKITRHLKGDKVIVFKKKRRKGYRKKNGHRQYLTEIVIESIGASAKTPASKETPDKTKPSKETEKPASAPPAAKAMGERDKVTAGKEETAKKTEAPKAKKETQAKAAPAKAKAPKAEEVSENLVTRAGHRAEEAHVKMDVDKLLHSIGTATKAEADDLKEIDGIGPAYEERLNEVGIYTFEQISKLKAADRDNLAGLEGITRDKIESDEWVKQAKALLKKKQ